MEEAERTQSYTEEHSTTVIQPSTSFTGKFVFWKNRKRPLKPSFRTVVPSASIPANVPSKHHPHKHCRDNKIRTTKYTVLSFVPKNLFEQFHRFANLYFIAIVLLNFVPPINAFGKEIAIIPVVFVFGVTAIKDWFEDYRRYKSDKRVNNLTCRVYNREAGRYVKTVWKRVQVGDIVHLSCNEVIPADILLLRCSDENGLCYIETANIDGESNLKQRQVPRGFLAHMFEPNAFDCKIECDMPNHQIYKFNGCIVHPIGEKTPINKDNLLLRDCVLKNADFIEGIVVYAGHETKAMLNNGGPRYKRSSLEKLMNQDVIFCVVILLLLCFLGALSYGFWLNSFDDYFSVPFIVTLQNRSSVIWESFIVFWTLVIVLQVMIPISLYVTVEIIKLGQVYFIHEDVHLYDSTSNKRVECRALNITEELGQVQYVFSDKTGTLTENNMIFRRCTIGGIDYNHQPPKAGDASDDKYDAPKEFSNSDAIIQNQVLQDELSKMEIQLRIDSSSTQIVHLSDHKQRIQDFFLLLAVCNTVVVSKYPHKDQMNSSGLCLNDPSPLNFGRKRLGEAWECNGQKYAHLISYTSTPTDSTVSTPIKRPPNSLTIPAIIGFSGTLAPTPSPVLFRPIYEAESPDEIALVNAAFAYNCRLLRRTPDSVVLSLPGEGLIEFQVLHVLPFDATRKRMSIILEHPFTGQKIIYCKGADSTILPQLAPVQTNDAKEIILKTQHHLHSYSRKGLRILCMAKKVIPKADYDAWLEFHKEAERSFDKDKERKLYHSACAIETKLELLGATGIEDKLQVGVPETIVALRSAGIVIWVLTGDKQETAVNIAYSCNLFTTDMEVITLNVRSPETAEETISFYLDQINKDVVTGRQSRSSSIWSSNYLNLKFGRIRENSIECASSGKRRALVIDGHSLSYILENPLEKQFLKLAQHCISVLCCRATPRQKASIVKLTKEALKVKTLAIGDGANDVSMIQVADVGIGINGKEGMQAVMASDFGVARFRFLERLLLVHGHWCYDRLARIILYFFYKNASFIFVLCWYQWFCGFSGSVMIDEIYLMMFNVLFSSLPPLILGIFDQNCPDYVLLCYPKLYAQGQKSEIHSKYSFWINMLDAIYQSSVTFFVPFFAYNDSNVDIWEFGTTICTCSLLVQLLHLATETKSWTVFHVLGIMGSTVIFFGFAALYNAWPAMSAIGSQNPYWVVIVAMESAIFWLCIVLVPILSCLPRVICRGLKESIFPSAITSTLQKLKNKNNSSDKSTVSASWSRASSVSFIDFCLNNRVSNNHSNSGIKITTEM